MPTDATARGCLPFPRRNSTSVDIQRPIDEAFVIARDHSTTTLRTASPEPVALVNPVISSTLVA